MDNVQNRGSFKLKVPTKILIAILEDMTELQLNTINYIISA
jgi:hypothetical protein